MIAGVPPPDHGSGFWFGAWTAIKLVAVLVVGAIIAISMVASTDATETPVAQSVGSPTPAPTVKIAGPIPTAQPTSVVPQDVFIPGRLIYVKGSTIYLVHHYDAPVPLATGREPSVSPDGKRLAYIQFFKNYQNLMLLNIQQRSPSIFLDSSPTNPVDVSTGFTASTPAWSDDGASIYFAWSYPGAPLPANTNNFDRTDLSISRCAFGVPCTTSTASKLTTPYFQSGGDFEPAPRLGDPNYFVYTKWQYQQARDNTSRSLPRLVAQSLSTGLSVDITNAQDNISEPVWSPNGRYLAFVKTSDDLQSSSIRIMTFHPPGNVNDYARSRLLVQGSPFAAHPVFSPDGKYMAFLKQGDDGRLRLFVARVHFGQNAHIDTPQEVKRADIVDGDYLQWTR